MTILEAFRRDEIRVLDRLVDDEFAPDERRELLAALDDEPGAWRRCALAFLEAQAWRRQLARPAAEPAHAASGLAILPAHRKNRRALWGACLAVAACLLVSFELGTRFPTVGLLPDAPQPMIAQQQITPSERGPQTDLAQSDQDSEDDEPWETLTLTNNADPQNDIQLRVVEADDDDQKWLTNAQSAVPVELLQQFEQAGLEVKHQQRLLPIELSDGRRLIVPIEQVDVHYPESIQY
jgi:hypothetical protein